MTYNVFSGTLNPTQYSMYIWRRRRPEAEQTDTDDRQTDGKSDARHGR